VREGLSREKRATPAQRSKLSERTTQHNHRKRMSQTTFRREGSRTKKGYYRVEGGYHRRDLATAHYGKESSNGGGGYRSEPGLDAIPERRARGGPATL